MEVQIIVEHVYMYIIAVVYQITTGMCQRFCCFSSNILLYIIILYIVHLTSVFVRFKKEKNNSPALLIRYGWVHLS